MVQLLKELDMGYGLPTTPVIIKADNQSAIALSKDVRYHTRTKYIDIQWYFVREQVALGSITIEYIPTKEIAADSLTKALDRVKFQRFVVLIGLTKE